MQCEWARGSWRVDAVGDRAASLRFCCSMHHKQSTLLFWALLASLALNRVTGAQQGVCGCHGCDGSRTYEVTTIKSERLEGVKLLWTATVDAVNGSSGAGCIARCVSSGEGKVLCGYAHCNTARSRQVAVAHLQQPSLVAFSAATGQTAFTSSELPSADTTPVVVQDASTFVITSSESAMAAVDVRDGAFVGSPITAPLAGAAPPAVTGNGVVMWLMQQGKLAGYLTNGVPHASMDVPIALTVPGIGGSDLNSVFFVSAPPVTRNSCMLTRVDVARTMNERFVTAWSRPVQCPHIPARSTERKPAVSSTDFAPLAVANNLVVFGGDTARGCSAQLVAIADGTLVRCVATAGAPISAIAVQGGTTVWLAVAADRALYRVSVSGTPLVTRVSLDTVLTKPGEELVGPIAVSTIITSSLSATAIFAAVRGSSGSLRALGGMISNNTSVITPLWSVGLPATTPDGEHGISMSTNESGTQLIYTMGSTVAAVGL